MDLNDMVIVSVDDHIIEPPHLFERHLAKRFLPKAPVVRHIAEKNEDIWEFEGKPTIGPQLNAVVGRPKEELGYEPTGYGQIRAGCWQPAARIDPVSQRLDGRRVGRSRAGPLHSDVFFAALASGSRR
jgi:hypothetical protein